MSNIVLFGSIAVLLFYYLTRIIGEIVRRADWHYWYAHFYLKSIHWKILVWRKDLQMRILHGRIFCEKCGRENYLQTHHVTYKRLGHEKLSDLQKICKFCHRKGPGKI